MRSAAGRIIIKIVILLGCIACVVTKALTDQLARRVFLRNQKLSREWGLLHNLFWSPSGNAFANVTYGGFTLITVLMLISRFIDAKSRPSLVEKIFLTVGMLCFFAMGGLVLSAFDQVPSDLHINAIVLTCLSFFVGMLMLLDLADPMARHISDTTQTDFQQNVPPAPLAKELNRDPHPVTTRTVANVHDQPDNSRTDRRSSAGIDTADGQYFRGDRVEFFQTQTLPIVQQPVFEKMLLPEKQRSKKQNIPDPKDNVAKLTYAGNDLNAGRQKQHRDRTDGIHRTEHQHRSELQHQPDNQHRSDYRNDRQPDRGYDYQTERTYSQQKHQPKIQSQRSTTTRSSPDRYDYRLNQDYSRQSTYNYSKNPQNYDNFRRSPSNSRQHSARRKNSCCSSGPDDDDRQPSAIQPGFVANAARFWDNKAKKSNELNTIV